MPPSSLAPQLADWLAREQAGGVHVVGINGAQGSGKSTLATALVQALAARYGLRAVVLSLDDLYLTHAERQALAHTVHPLFATRGVPGTHDVVLGTRLLDELPHLGSGATLALPQFLKLADDRAPPERWAQVTGPVDLVLFEGWCVATPPQAEAALATPVNALERMQDSDGRWRRAVNTHLATNYAVLFRRVQRLIFLAAPGFGCVVDWRLEQEATTATREPGRALSHTEIEVFVAYYERLTRHALATLPHTADVVVQLTPARTLQALESRR
ncbi:MAG: kinase [Nevskiaceae bacterium]|nr:MAG: kinase [Nevskiaceae bacterium]TBR72108.1 MAG: kinase [Nevskiaceae bacterium]